MGQKGEQYFGVVGVSWFQISMNCYVMLKLPVIMCYFYKVNNLDHMVHLASFNHPKTFQQPLLYVSFSERSVKLGITEI